MFSIRTKNNTQTNKPQQMQMQMTVMPFMRSIHKPLPVAQKTIEPTIYSPSDGDRMKWGKHIWTFFHTIAHKVHPDFFPHIKKGLLDMVYTICSSLPCPMCTEHAKKYMNGVNFNAIITKDDLINMFFAFHNAVNARKNYKPFSKEDLFQTYENQQLMVVIHNFMIAYKDRHRSMKLLADDMIRVQYAANISNWLQNNLKYFSS